MTPASTRRARALSFTRLLPNVITLLGLCAGLTGVRFAVQERWEPAVAAIVIAAALDGIDGRIARMLNASSRFGAELDSLSDFICFGAAPALIIWMWALSDAGPLGWMVCLLFAVCCVLRLARFNTQVLGEDELPSWSSRYFTGVAAPAGAGYALIPMALYFETEWGFLTDPWVIGPHVAVIGALMVSRWPSYSFKKIRVPKAAALPVLFLVVILAAFLVSNTWLTLALIGIGFMCTLPFSLLSYHRLSKGQNRVVPGLEGPVSKKSDGPAGSKDQGNTP